MFAGKMNTRGVTLVELTLVVTLLAIIAGIGIPTMTSMFSISTLEAAGVEVITAIEFAQLNAATKGQAHRVTIDAANESIELRAETIAVSLLGSESELEETDVETKTFSLFPHPLNSQSDYAIDFDGDSRYQDVEVATVNWDSGTFLEFDADGTPSTGGTVSIQNSATTLTLTIDPITGRVSMD